MTFATPGKDSIWLTTSASLVADDDTSRAWAEKHIQYSPALKWLVANFVQSDKPNSNQHYWSQDDLRFGQPFIAHSPINLLHSPRRIIGHLTNSEMVFPTEASLAEDGSIETPYIEVLGALYRHYFPNEMAVIERAHSEGALTVSMECSGRSVTCDGPAGCGKEFDFKGDHDPSYCGHLNSNASYKHINDPIFLACGVLVPPVKPGWNRASVTQMASLTKDMTKEYAKECELAYAGLQQELPHLSPKEWEPMMATMIQMAMNTK